MLTWSGEAGGEFSRLASTEAEAEARAEAHRATGGRPGARTSVKDLRRRLSPRRRPGRAARRRTLARTGALAVPMALGLALGVIMAQSGGPAKIAVTAAGAQSTPSADAPGTASPAATATANPNANANAANMDCELIVPPNPLSAAGLATPYLLTGPDGQDPAASGCTQANPNLQAFVQATILNPATGRLWVYEPLVITEGTNPAAGPARPKLPRNAVVNLMVGFNGNNLQLTASQPETLGKAKCVNGLPGSPFGQVAYCNSVPFYAAADQDIAAGKLRIPRAGRSPLTGQRCPTTRSFQLADQDPSDNVTTKYLLTADGRTAQDNPANTARFQQSTTISNGSDNALLDNFILPALGCTAFTAPDLSDAGQPGTSQTLDELAAAANQRAPIALVPENDPMTLVNGALSRPKTNLYRLGVGQPLVIGGPSLSFGDSRAGGQQADTPANFCANMLNIQTAFIAADQSRFSAAPSPVPATGNNLFTFLAARLAVSFTNLGCNAFGLHTTVSLSQDAHGVAVAAAFSLALQAPNPQDQQASQPTPSAPPLPSTSPWNPWTPWGDNGNGWGNAGYGD